MYQHNSLDYVGSSFHMTVKSKLTTSIWYILMNKLLDSVIQKLDKKKCQSQRTCWLTASASGSISDGDSNLSKQCPDIVQTKSSLVGSITTSLHVSSHTGKKKTNYNVLVQTQIFKQKNEKLMSIIKTQTTSLTMNMSSLLANKYISNMMIRACFARASVISHHCITKASAFFIWWHLISNSLVKNHPIIFQLSIWNKNQHLWLSNAHRMEV